MTSGSVPVSATGRHDNFVDGDQRCEQFELRSFESPTVVV